MVKNEWNKILKKIINTNAAGKLHFVDSVFHMQGYVYRQINNTSGYFD